MSKNSSIPYKTVVTFTDRERLLLSLARDGYRQKEMCSVISRSWTSVKRYWMGIEAKLGARTAAQAVALAIQKHVIGAYNIGSYNIEHDNHTRLVRGLR